MNLECYYQFFFTLLLAYFLGSFPTGYIIAKLKGIDITKIGSGNIGMANVFRTLGPSYGIIVLLIDTLKGFLPTFIAIKMNFPALFVLVVGITAIMGHIFTIFLRFKGGKGVATSLGVILAISPILALSCFIVWFLTVIITRYSSLGSILAALSATIITFLYQFNIFNLNLLNIQLENKLHLTIFCTSIFIFILYLHRENIRRIIKGTENKIF
ncbi:MAG: glycerol-3-phosphate 1-O-acyltransferase PlsY [Candidatus Calescibacterium sp.]|nr:glycerol-3-phosphate 1-O-acyltransferase PlsY [Candidatus Calescibacterium sp.]MCX7971782.1 glycerol-3-phosphate 1-O-acyltransferase PlsY [bacterium]MDW8195388.1 glycerol-3-phosphate 1-O-acyltransferase PlsY [Candidatus Calescibacterium sp.]